MSTGREKHLAWGLPWKLIASLLVVIVVIAGLAWWLWPRGGGGPGENVRFDYQMWFTYYGSEENVPLDNIRLDWSAPKVDNLLPESLEAKITWDLYYIEDDNTLTLQATLGGHENFRGERTSALVMYEFGHADSGLGPVYAARFDRLYPREVFVMLGYEIDDKEAADGLTLKVYGQIDSIAGWGSIEHENQRIHFSIWVGLWRENALVEQFVEPPRENGPYGWYWLEPVS